MKSLGDLKGLYEFRINANEKKKLLKKKKKVFPENSDDDVDLDVRFMWE